MIHPKKFVIGLLLSLSIASMPMHALTGGPAVPPIGQQGQPPLAPQLSPEQEEKAMQELNDMFEKMSPADWDNMAKLGADIVKNSSDDELKPVIEELQKAGFADITLDKLREEAKGMDAAPAEQPAQEEKDEDVVAEEKAPIATPDAKSTSAIRPLSTKQSSTKDTLDKLIEHIDALIQKGSSLQLKENKLKSWGTDLNNLVFYLRVINKQEHYDRLAKGAYIDMLKKLEELKKALDKNVGRITVPDITKTEEDSPYTILDVEKSATQKEIKKAYDTKVKEYDIEALESRLKEEGATDKDIKREKKAAQLSLQTLQDAYEKIGDQGAREQYDREPKAQEDLEKQLSGETKEALEKVTDAIAAALYTDEILNKLEAFLKEYEPAELEKKKRS